MLSKRKLQLLTFLVIFSQIFGEEMPTDDGSFIECNYFFTGSYECIMSILNENGRDDFEGIGGNHLPGFSDSHVDTLRAVTQITTNIPQIICQQFPNLREFHIIFSAVEELSENSLASCENLVILVLDMNHLETISDGIFTNNQLLTSLSLADNQISEISTKTFENLELENLDISRNLISSLASIRPLFDTLKTFIAPENQISLIPQGTFNFFSNLTLLDLGINQISVLDSQAFVSMNSLDTFLLDSNQIQTIDERIFTQMPNLMRIDLRTNLCANRNFVDVPEIREEMLEELQGCFEGFEEATNISCVYSSGVCSLEIYNPGARDDFTRIPGEHEIGTNDEDITVVFIFQQITKNVPQIICQQFQNLAEFYIYVSQVEVLTENSFSHCHNMIYLDIVLNNIAKLPDLMLVNNQRLFQLILNQNQIKEISPLTFKNSSVEGLFMAANELRDFPDGTFDGLENLLRFDVAENQLQKIDSDWFGTSLKLIESFWGNDNEISFIDEKFFDGAVSLQILDLLNNQCINASFSDVSNNRDLVRSSLSDCFGVEPPPDGTFIECTYENLPNGYTCILSINNPLAFDNFARIAGNHLESQNDDDVMALEAFFEHTLNVPQVICRQFTNLRFIMMELCGISILSKDSFADCENLETLSLGFNEIHHLSENLFANAGKLKMAAFTLNQIEEISPKAFSGASIEILELSFNNLRDLESSFLTEIHESLQEIFLVQNFIENLPENIFNGFSSISIIDVGFNELKNISSTSFGGSLENLSVFFADHNLLDAIDRRFFENSANLQELYLINNFCVSENFTEIGDNRETVAESLEKCFINYGGEEPGEGFISCSYASNPPSYNCLLTIINPDGLEFNSIAGSHLPGFSDADVIEVSAWSQNTAIIPQVICRQFTNLNNLLMLDSHVKVLTPSAFEFCSQIEQLAVILSDIEEIPGSLFINSPRLRFINLEANKIERIAATAFAGLSNSLQQISFGTNLITNLPFGLFNNLNIIDRISFGFNRISILDSRSFGSSLSVVGQLAFHSNAIDAIDEEIVENSENLQTLMLASNLCVNLNFGNVSGNRDFVREQLTSCFENFQGGDDDAFANCFYFSQPAFDSYTCFMTIYNPNGRELSSIGGEHLQGFSDSDVTDVVINNQITTNLPSIICQKFFNTRLLSSVSSQIEILGENSLRNCRNLQILSITLNLIAEIPQGALNSLTNLYEIDFHGNRLSVIHANSFGSDVLPNLLNVYLHNNQIDAIDPDFFDDATEMRILFLSGNICAQFNFNDVSGFREAVRQLLQACFDNFWVDA